jgi:Transposase DDE domain
MPKAKDTTVAQQLHEFLNERVRLAGRVSGFVQRASKLSAEVFVKTLVWGLAAKPQASLSEWADQSAALGVSISPQSLDERINERAVTLLQDVFRQALQVFQSQTKLAGASLTPFSSIHLLDSSIMTLPAHMQMLFAGCKTAGGEAALKGQLSFEYLRGRLSAVQVEAGRCPDQKCRLQLDQAEANSLHIFDLGYFTVAVLEALDKATAFVISRFQFQTALYPLGGASDKIELAQVLAHQSGTLYEHAYQMGQANRLPVRLIAQRLPEPAAAQRHRKTLAKLRKKGRTPSATYLALLDWTIFVTNVPATRLTALQVMAFYRLRWQIELVFKLWKSCAQLDYVGAWRTERVLCVLYAKLIGLVIFHWLVAPERIVKDRELSYPKAFHCWQDTIPTLSKALTKAPRKLAAVCHTFTAALRRKALKTRRRKSLSTYQLLLSLEATVS